MKTWLKKWFCVLSNLIASIWTRSICQMQATFPVVEFLRTLFRLRKMKENSTSSIKRQIRRFHVVVVQWTSKKSTKKRDARAELLFWSLNLLLFWSRCCRRRRSCLSSLVLTKPCVFWNWFKVFIMYFQYLNTVFLLFDQKFKFSPLFEIYLKYS